MRYTIIITLAIIVVGPFWAYVQSQDTLIPYRAGDYWGFSDLQDEIIIQPKYDSVRWFQGGLAAVGKNLRFGFVNTSGEEVIKLAYSSVTDYDTLNKMIKVTIDGKYRVIGPDGNRIKGNTTWIGKAKRDCAEIKGILSYDPYIYESNEKFGLIEYLCNDVSADSCIRYLPPVYVDFRGFGNYIAALKQNDNWALMRIANRNEFISPFIYDDVIVHPDKPFDPATLTIVEQNDGFGFVNADGKLVISPQYDKVEFFENGFARVQVNGNWGYIGKSGIRYFNN